MNAELFGVLEWVSSQGGDFSNFNPGLIQGTVRGLRYRYFIDEGWIGLRDAKFNPGESVECKTLSEFIYHVTQSARQKTSQQHEHTQRD